MRQASLDALQLAHVPVCAGKGPRMTRKMCRPAKMPDAATRAKIAKLHVVYGITYNLLGLRFGMSRVTVKKICDMSRKP
jgi:hypothetical protein